jgi:predicted DNA-binding transcriptional regulator AlpA
MRRKPKRHHLDRRAAQIINFEGGDDDLLRTREVADWLGVSTQWVELSRVNNYGPPYKKLGPKSIRYLRRDVRKWLETRTQHAESAA